MKVIKLLICFICLFAFLPLSTFASTDYYYADNKKIYLEEVTDKKVYKLENNKKKIIKLKSAELKQVYPKSFYYRVDFSNKNTSQVDDLTKRLRTKSILELPFYREVDAKEELIITDDYLVSFKEYLLDDEIEEIIDKQLNSEIVEPLHYVLDGKGFHLRLRNPQDNVIFVSNKCVENGWCVWAHPNFIRKIYLNATPSDTYFPQQWHLKTINAEQAWDITKGSSNITIAVIDDGFDFDHEEFKAPGKITKKFNLIEGNEDTRLYGSGTSLELIKNVLGSGSFSHGTSVGGLAAAPDNGKGVVGVCPNCMLMPIRIAIDDSVGSALANFLLVSDLVAASGISKAVDEGADIINCSWGGGYVTSDVERNAIDYAHRVGRGGKGSIVVFSAGNGDLTSSSCRTGPVTAPGSYNPVIAVGATDKIDKIACYSSTGPQIDLVAPGGNDTGEIVTTDLVGIFGYSPKNALSSFILNLLGGGKTWTLSIADLFSGQTGQLNSWSLEYVDVFNRSFPYKSNPMLTIPDGRGFTTSSPGTILISGLITDDVLDVINVEHKSGIPLIKEIYFSLDITHPRGYDISAILEVLTEGSLFPPIDLFELTPSNFPKNQSFIPINKLKIAEAVELPTFDLDKNGDYTNDFSGTSAAAPIVSGLAGLILSANPNLSYQQVEQVLKDTADKIDSASVGYDSTGHSNIYGYGRINALNAVQRARDFSNPPIIVPTPKPTPIPTIPPTSSSDNLLVTPSEAVITINGIPSGIKDLDIPITIDDSVITLGESTSSVNEAIILEGKPPKIIIFTNASTLPSDFTITIPFVGLMVGNSVFSISNSLSTHFTMTLVPQASATTNVSSVTVTSIQPTPTPSPGTSGASKCNSNAGCNIGHYCNFNFLEGGENVGYCSQNPPGCVTGCTNNNQCSVGSSCISNCCINNQSISLISLPQAKRNVLKLIAEGNNFTSSSNCSVDAATLEHAGLKMNVFPKSFIWDSEHHRTIIQVIIPKNLRKSLYKQANTKIIVVVDVSCSNGAETRETIIFHK